MSVASESKSLDPELYRPDFPILSTVLHGSDAKEGVPLAYLDNAATSQRPRSVIQAIVDTYERQYANVHRGIHWLADQSTDLYEDARQKVRRLINAASTEQIVFTTGTTGAINLVARSWGDANVRAGDEIVLSEMEHHSNLVPWQQLAERTGVRLRHIPITDDGRLDLEFVPFLERVAKTNLLVITSAVHQMFGRYRGTVRADDGEVIAIDGLIGFAEEHHARW